MRALSRGGDFALPRHCNISIDCADESLLARGDTTGTGTGRPEFHLDFEGAFGTATLQTTEQGDVLLSVRENQVPTRSIVSLHTARPSRL